MPTSLGVTLFQPYKLYNEGGNVTLVRVDWVETAQIIQETAQIIQESAQIIQETAQIIQETVQIIQETAPSP